MHRATPPRLHRFDRVFQHCRHRCNHLGRVHEYAQADGARIGHNPVNRLHGTRQNFELITFHIGLGGDHDLLTRFQILP